LKNSFHSVIPAPGETSAKDPQSQSRPGLVSSDFASPKYLRKNGGPGIDMTITNFVPRLKRAGVDDRTLRTILVENPRRVLTFAPHA
jgi:predicted metal-dependent phosphotriesterase family hydrolase